MTSSLINVGKLLHGLEKQTLIYPDLEPSYSYRFDLDNKIRLHLINNFCPENTC